MSAAEIESSDDEDGRRQWAPATAENHPGLAVLTTGDPVALAAAVASSLDQEHEDPDWINVALVARPGASGGETSYTNPPRKMRRWIRVSKHADSRVAGTVMLFPEVSKSPSVRDGPYAWFFAKVDGVYTEYMRIKWQADFIESDPEHPLRPMSDRYWRTRYDPRAAKHGHRAGASVLDDRGARLYSNPYRGPSQNARPADVLGAVSRVLNGLDVNGESWRCLPRAWPLVIPVPGAYSAWAAQLRPGHMGLPQLQHYSEFSMPQHYVSYPRMAAFCDGSIDLEERLFENRCCPEVYATCSPSHLLRMQEVRDVFERLRVLGRNRLLPRISGGIQALADMAVAASIDKMRSFCGPNPTLRNFFTSQPPGGRDALPDLRRRHRYAANINPAATLSFMETRDLQVIWTGGCWPAGAPAASLEELETRGLSEMRTFAVRILERDRRIAMLDSLRRLSVYRSEDITPQLVEYLSPYAQAGVRYLMLEKPAEPEPCLTLDHTPAYYEEWLVEQMVARMHAEAAAVAPPILVDYRGFFAPDLQNFDRFTNHLVEEKLWPAGARDEY